MRNEGVISKFPNKIKHTYIQNSNDKIGKIYDRYQNKKEGVSSTSLNRKIVSEKDNNVFQIGENLARPYKLPEIPLIK